MDQTFHNLRILLNRGFLSSTVEIDSAKLLVKQITRSDLSRIRYFTPGSSKDSRRYIKSGLVAASLVAINGENILHKKNEMRLSLIKVLSAWPSMVVDKILDEAAKITIIYRGLFSLVPSFSRTEESRMLWRSLGRENLLSESWTGWEGTSLLGRDEVHSFWTTFQILTDTMEEESSKLFYLKCLLAPHSSEAVRKIETLERAREKNWNSLTLWNPKEDSMSSDLVEELERSISGEYDDHDIAVMSSEEALLKEYLEKDSEIRAHREDILSCLPSNITTESRELFSNDLVDKSPRFLIRSRDSGGIFADRNEGGGAKI